MSRERCNRATTQTVRIINLVQFTQLTSATVYPNCQVHVQDICQMHEVYVYFDVLEAYLIM